ncbi:MAG: crossover junction endodeoxyribonuclease RuvC [Actinomycetota bacterium]|nr:crossover junction endodeoxyribonuclease RuvC [Actinomycetota bacterium]
MRVLGIDPGLTRCGYAVIDGSPGRSPSAITYSVVRTPPGAELGERLMELSDAIAEVIRTYQPEVLAVERVFSQHNVRTVMGTGQAAGVAILAAARAGIAVAMYTPTEVKAAVTGSGNAEKAQVSAMVTRLLRLSEPPRPADAADALALAICHAWRGTALHRRALATTGVAGALPAGAWGAGR